MRRPLEKFLMGSGMMLKDISALAGMPLVSVRLGGTEVAHLTPLRGAPLKTIELPSRRLLTEESVALMKEFEKTCEVQWTQ